MPRYFLHLRDGLDDVLDPDGTEFATMDAVHKAVIEGARELASVDVKKGVLDLRYRIDAEDENGRVVYSMPFDKAVAIIFPPPTTALH